MSHETTPRNVRTRSCTCSGVAIPTVSAIPTRFTPDLIDFPVDGQQVDQVAPERVLAAEAHLQPLALDELNHLHRAVDDLANRLAVRELAQVAARAEQHVDAVHARVHSQARVVQVAARVGQQLGPQPEPGDARAIRAGSAGSPLAM